jgi:hypothetical protein
MGYARRSQRNRPTDARIVQSVASAWQAADLSRTVAASNNPAIGTDMDMKLGVRTLLILALVAVATCAILQQELFGDADPAQSTAVLTVVAMHHP